MAKSNETAVATKAAGNSKPEKPYEGFPLFPHATKRWAKKIRGKLCYFGSWADGWQKALDQYQEQRDDLHAGRAPRANRDGLTVAMLVDKFLNTKRHLVDTRELTARSWADYYSTCQRVVEAFGKNRLVEDLRAEDFEKLRAKFAKTRSPVTLGNEIQRVRVLMKYAFDSSLIDTPIRYGQTFKRPSKATIRRERQAKGLRMFEAAELRKIIDAAGVPLKAMLLLAANCGFGNRDVGSLPITALDLEAGWVTFPRPKTAIQRRCWLWPETVETIRAALAERPEPKDKAHAGLVFLTRCGAPWAKLMEMADDPTEQATFVDCPVAKETRKLLDTLGLHQHGRGFYAIRHGFETIGGASRDQVAVDHIMGHADASMAATYRERVDDDRLKAVAEHVRNWLFAEAVTG